MLQYGVKEAKEIADHFDNSFELEHQIFGTSKEKYLIDIRDVMNKCDFIFMRQREMLGLGHAILTGESMMGPETFAVVLADILCAKQMVMK
ncbi:MAG: hypothetical protein HRT92_06825 [Piscirickettsiaceae bacterium]|nr:hypothetical protein [Piscirickettsiaceae bacterium]